MYEVMLMVGMEVVVHENSMGLESRIGRANGKFINATQQCKRATQQDITWGGSLIYVDIQYIT